MGPYRLACRPHPPRNPISIRDYRLHTTMTVGRQQWKARIVILE